MTETAVVAQAAKRPLLLTALADKYQIEPRKFLETIKATIFDNKGTEEELIAFLTVAHRYDLDPFRKEIYAFRKGDTGGVQPIVGIDGWATIANREPAYDGVEFEDQIEAGVVTAVTCRVYRKDRSRPTSVTEYLRECKRNTPPWNQMPGRMLRHRSYIQGVRLAFGISGIMDPEDAERMVDAEVRVIPNAPLEPAPKVEALKRAARKPAAATPDGLHGIPAQAAPTDVAAAQEPTQEPWNEPPPMVADGVVAGKVAQAAPQEPDPLWKSSKELPVVFLDITRRSILNAEQLKIALGAYGASRGHKDGMLGLADKPAERASLVERLKADCERELKAPK